jgi:hypothetical protein
VGCILLRYVYVYLSNIPAIATENLLVLLLFSLFATCFGLYGPSSGDTTTSLTYFEKTIDTTTDPLFYNCSLIWCLLLSTKKTKKTPWSESASELYRPSDLRLSASDRQLVRIEGATWSAWRIPPAVFSRFSRQEPLLYQVAPRLYSRGWVDPVQTHYSFSL